MDSKPDSCAANGCSSREPQRDAGEQLSHQAASFIRLWDKKEARMTDLLDEIKEMAVEIKKMHRNAMRSCYTAAVSAVVTIGAGIAVPFAGGLGFAVTAALTSAAACGALFGFKIKQFRTEQECLKQIKQFLKCVNRLQHELEEILRTCEDLHRGSEKAQRDRASGLRDNLLRLFQGTETLRTADRVKELTDQCPEVFAGIHSIKTQLEPFRRHAETQSLQVEHETSFELSSESSLLILQDTSKHAELKTNANDKPKEKQGNAGVGGAGGGGGPHTDRQSPHGAENQLREPV